MPRYVQHELKALYLSGRWVEPDLLHPTHAHIVRRYCDTSVAQSFTENAHFGRRNGPLVLPISLRFTETAPPLAGRVPGRGSLASRSLPWEFDERGLMRRREASINDVRIDAAQRLLCWEGERRPDDYPGLSALGL